MGTRLLNVDRNRRRGNAVGNHNQLAGPRLLVRWNIEVGGDQAVKRDGHAAVVVRAAVKDVPGCVVCNAHERVIGGGLNVVAIRRTLRHSIEEVTGDGIGASRANGRRITLDTRRPGWIVASSGSVNLDVAREICEQDLSCGKNQEVANERPITRSARWTRNRIEIGAIPFQNRYRTVAEAGARHHQDVAVRLQRRGTVSNVEVGRKVRTWGPGGGAHVIDCRVPGGSTAAGVGSRSKDCAVGAQN